MGVFKRKDIHLPNHAAGIRKSEKTDNGQGELQTNDGAAAESQTNPNAKKKRGIQPDGESGRKFFHPLKFFPICWRSSSHVSKYTNLLWPFTVAALVLRFNFNPGPESASIIKLWIFVCAYIGMVPAANLLGFAGQELARKIPKVIGVVLETTLGSLVEIILFMVLISKGHAYVPVIQAAILGSILANLLLCLGLCFFVGGIFWPEQRFHEAISEVGSNLTLVAGLGLIIPSIYYNSLVGNNPQATGLASVARARLIHETEEISHATAIILIVAFFMYVWFQTRSHHPIFEEILEQDEEQDHDRHRDLQKEKLTMTESLLAVAIAIMFVAFMAVILVDEIEYMVVEHNVSDHFIGLILVPVVEKFSEHLTAIDEAYDNQMNFALAHVLGATIQTALLNTPLVVFVGWGLGYGMNLNFQLFDSVVLILAIIVVGNFLRDEKSDYLEGALCVFVYILIAITAFYYPNPREVEELIEAGGFGAEHAEHAAEKLRMLLA